MVRKTEFSAPSTVHFDDTICISWSGRCNERAPGSDLDVKDILACKLSHEEKGTTLAWKRRKNHSFRHTIPLSDDYDALIRGAYFKSMVVRLANWNLVATPTPIAHFYTVHRNITSLALHHPIQVATTKVPLPQQSHQFLPDKTNHGLLSTIS